MRNIIISAMILVSVMGYSQCRKYREYSPLQLSVNYGAGLALGGELLYQNNKNIIGVGYIGSVATNKSYLNLNQEQYHVKNEALYLTYARQIDGWVVGVKVGKQNMADWNKTATNNGGGYTFVKDANDYTAMVGIYGGCYVTDVFRINIGVDSFSTMTLGFTVGL